VDKSEITPGQQDTIHQAFDIMKDLYGSKE